MLLKDDKKGLVTIIMKKMKEHSIAPSMSSEQAMEKPMLDGAEQDYEAGHDACCEDMMKAFKSGDSRLLKKSLKSFISMVLDERDLEQDDD